MRTRHVVPALTLIALWLGVLATAGAAEPPKLNVLFLIADDLNCDLGCYGHSQVKSPHIDALAARGVLFERAYCQFPVCGPSRTSFLTGRRPNSTQIHSNPAAGRFSTDYRPTPHFREFIPETLTLPQLFRRHGYFVARVGKIFHYGVPGQIGTSGLDDVPSWEYVVNPAGRDKAEENQIFTLLPGKSYGGTLSWLATDGTDLEQTDGLGATAAISLLEQQKDSDRPFFLAVGFYRPHTPYVAPNKYFDLYPLDSIKLPSLSEEDRKRMPEVAWASDKPEQQTMTDTQRRQAIQAYWATVSFMDAQVGRVLEALDRLNLRDNTIVIMTSDHGYHLYEHGLWQKMSLFENAARVPLIVSVPGARGNGQKTKALAELIDLYPTLAGAMGFDVPEYVDGTSLQPILDDPAASVKAATYTQLRRNGYDAYSVRTERYRYSRWDDGRLGEQLFDLESDPGETRNLAGDPQHRAVVEEHRVLIGRISGVPKAE